MNATTLIESARAADAQKKAEAMARYRERLARNASPEKNDPKGLLVDLEILGKTAADLEADLRIVQRAADLERQAMEHTAELDEEIKQAHAAWSDHQAETARLVRERKAEEARLWSQVRALDGKRHAARAARGQLKLLRDRHYALFGLPAPEPAPTPFAGMRAIAANMPPPDNEPLRPVGVMRRGPRNEIHGGAGIAGNEHLCPPKVS